MFFLIQYSKKEKENRGLFYLEIFSENVVYYHERKKCNPVDSIMKTFTDNFLNFNNLLAIILKRGTNDRLNWKDKTIWTALENIQTIFENFC